MSKALNIYIALIFLVLFPVLEIGGHFIPFQELYLYLAVVVAARSLKKNLFASSYFFYFVGFFIVVVITSLAAQSSINNHDIYILRNCLQAICAFFLFDRWLRVIRDEFDQKQIVTIIINCFIILSIPSFIVFAQKLNFLGFRDLMITLYKPQFHFLGADQFSQFRYTAVFKDFFTFACFSIVLCVSMFYTTLSMPLGQRQKYLMYGTLILNYLAQFFVARTSMLLIPPLLIVVLFLFPSKFLRGGGTRKITFLIFFVPFALLGVSALFYTEVVNVEWLQKGLGVLGFGKEIDTSSFDVMQKWNQDFFQYVIENPKILLQPFHSYDLTVTQNPSLYTDSFYAQEVYRYGVYGMLIYIIFAVKLLRLAKRNSYVFGICVVTFLLLNYKGGNVFFMHKNSYLYSFFFTAIMFVRDIYLKPHRGDADEATLSNPTVTLPR